MPFLTLLTSPVAKIAGVFALIIGLLIGAKVMVDQHDAKVKAELQAASNVAIMATMTADHAREIAALSDAVKAATQRANAATAAKGVINNAPNTTACAASPAIGAALDSLRRKPTGSH